MKLTGPAGLSIASILCNPPNGIMANKQVKAAGPEDSIHVRAVATPVIVEIIVIMDRVCLGLNITSHLLFVENELYM